jgi:RNA polymerase primary sigma factor
VDEQLLSQLGRNPTLEELAQALHMTMEDTAQVAKTLDAARVVAKAKAPEPEEDPQEDQAVEDTAYFQMRQRISELLSGLEPEDAQILNLRFGLEGGLPLTPEQTARKLGMTPGEVTAREAAALMKLRAEG